VAGRKILGLLNRTSASPATSKLSARSLVLESESYIAFEYRQICVGQVNHMVSCTEAMYTNALAKRRVLISTDELQAANQPLHR
jgi:hypothetical protein